MSSERNGSVLRVERHRSGIRRSACVMACLLMAGIAGCGSRGNNGPQRFDLSGAVVFDGQPIPSGYVTFEPDSSKGNPGPGASADIVAGHYRTRPAQGTIGGHHIVKVFGYDGKPFEVGRTPDGKSLLNQAGKPLFAPATLEVDLPRKATVYDIELPRER